MEIFSGIIAFNGILVIILMASLSYFEKARFKFNFRRLYAYYFMFFSLASMIGIQISVIKNMTTYGIQDHAFWDAVLKQSWITLYLSLFFVIGLHLYDWKKYLFSFLRVSLAFLIFTSALNIIGIQAVFIKRIVSYINT